MAVEINLPDIGPGELEVTEVMVKVGDKVSAEQSIITVEGDKTAIEVPTPFSGVVKEIKIGIRDKVKTGSLIMTLETEKISSSVGKNKEISVSEDFASKIITDKTITQVQPSLTKLADEFIENDAYVHATPTIRRLAREFGINLYKVTGTGHKGRILREDIQLYIKELIKISSEKTVNSSNFMLKSIPPWPQVEFSKFGDTDKIKIGRIQKISASNLYRNWIMVPHITQFDETDITELEIFRKQQNSEAKNKKESLKITLLVFIMKAVVKALEKFQNFNSSLSEDAQTLILKKYINIGIAVDTPNGLVVPVFRDVNKKGILELAHELTETSKKARDGKLTLSNMQGGCFTISSLGGVGGTAFTPIVNVPEVAILGVSKSLIKPVWNGEQFTPRLMLPLSLSYDHRVINGADGARFISLISNLMSDIRYLVM